MTILLYAALLLLGLTLLAVTVVRVLVGGLADTSPRTPTARPSSGESARRLLEVRYAAGELSTEEYQQRLRVLEGRDQ